MTNLEEVKLYLRVDHDDEDTLIENLTAAATEAVFTYLGQELHPLPSPVAAAILLLVGDLYENRERQADRPFMENPTYYRLLAPYRLVGI